MNLRHNRVFPVPTSPVILMKPSPFFAATNSVLRASWEFGQAKKKLVTGVIPNGNSCSPKWLVYMPVNPSLLFVPRSQSVRTRRFKSLNATLAFQHVLSPVSVALNNGRFDQDNQFALLHDLVGVFENRSQHRNVSRARHLRIIRRGGLPHQTADCHNLPILAT